MQLLWKRFRETALYFGEREKLFLCPAEKYLQEKAAVFSVF